MDAPPTHPHLRTLLGEAEAVRAEAERLRDTLTDDQLTWRPAPDVWSVADCFEHLRKVDKAYTRSLADAVERMAPGDADYAPSFIPRTFIGFVSPDPKRKLKAPKAVRPKDAEDAPPSARAEALDRFLDQQAELLRLIRAADGHDVNTGRFGSPFFAPLRFSVGEGLTMLVRHEQRHLGQAQRVTAHPDFPAA